MPAPQLSSRWRVRWSQGHRSSVAPQAVEVVLDLGAAIGSFGTSVPAAIGVSAPTTETVVAERTGNDLSALLSSWEATTHCTSLATCANCANPGFDCNPITSGTCGTDTYYFPTCCGNWDSNTCTFNGRNKCNPQCINCCN
jgi:hypothetical protein